MNALDKLREKYDPAIRELEADVHLVEIALKTISCIFTEPSSRKSCWSGFDASWIKSMRTGAGKWI